MRYINLFKLNDLDIKKYIIIVFSIQMAMYGSIALNLLNINLPIIRQLVAIIYLLFIPGTICLRCLKIHGLSSIESLLYSVGLSITYLMFIGFFINQLYFSLSLNKPISLAPLIIIINLFILILCLLCYKIDMNYQSKNNLDSAGVFSLSFLFLLLLPFLSIFGEYVLDIYQTYIPLMLLEVIICLIVILIGFSSIIPVKVYPFATYVISFSLLFQTSLLSSYIAGWDIQMEYYLSNLVIKNSFWDFSYSISNINSMLSISMLAPIFSQISNLSLVWTFKIIYPLIFSLVPLGLYCVFEKQIKDPKIVFLSVFFFMSLFVFYKEMLQLARQEIAEFYLVLILLITIDKNLSSVKKQFLLVLFSFSLIVSHYGISYLFILIIIITMALKHSYSLFNKSMRSKKETITFSFISLFLVFTVSWYIYMTGSSTFDTLIKLIDNIISSLYTDFLNPSTVEGLSFIKSQSTYTHMISKYLHFLCQILITIGFIGLYTKLKDRWNGMVNIDEDYKFLCGGFYFVLLLGITIPFFSSAMNTSRLYQISLIFLAPLCGLGGIILLKIIYSFFHLKWYKKDYDKYVKSLSLLLVLFFLFNSDFIYNLEEGHFSNSISIDHDYPRFNDQELLSANWLYKVKNENQIFADQFRFILLRSFDWTTVTPITENSVTGNISTKDYYVYLGSVNVLIRTVPIFHEIGEKINIQFADIDLFTQRRNKIYANGGSEIYFSTS